MRKINAKGIDIWNYLQLVKTMDFLQITKNGGTNKTIDDTFNAIVDRFSEISDTFSFNEKYNLDDNFNFELNDEIIDYVFEFNQLVRIEFEKDRSNQENIEIKKLVNDEPFDKSKYSITIQDIDRNLNIIDQINDALTVQIIKKLK